MLPLIIHGDLRSTRTRAVAMCCEEKGLAYRLEPVEYGSPAHLQQNPFGLIPVLQHAGEYLFETAAILYYVNDVAPGPELLPDEPRERALAMQWCSAALSQLTSAAAWCEQHDVLGQAEAIEQRFGELLLPFSLAIGEQEFVGTASLTLADLCLYPLINKLYGGQPTLAKDLSSLQRWSNMMALRDSALVTQVDYLHRRQA
ncbi:glutathione S-transferase family protein [Ferrimonas pelagia]|uniref:glutathione transferase n=1 Tax=Ferrimonas pelagia TaxID=1177826 RepID=A0ABP9EWN2_9GAMM